jgi:hypothetical protein
MIEPNWLRYTILNHHHLIDFMALIGCLINKKPKFSSEASILP